MPKTRAEAMVYGAAWQRVRRVVLQRDEYRCTIGMEGCTGAADAVDHIVPWRAGGDLYGLDNLRACCTSCNSKRAGGVNKTKRNPSREW